MTPGTDGETLDSFSEGQIKRLIVEMSDESYQCKPVRTVFIPKANGKLRKLGIPAIKDKLVQEVVLMILEAIYDSPEGAYFLVGNRFPCAAHVTQKSTVASTTV
jgi:retron-type reverse transcriptase